MEELQEPEVDKNGIPIRRKNGVSESMGVDKNGIPIKKKVQAEPTPEDQRASSSPSPTGENSGGGLKTTPPTSGAEGSQDLSDTEISSIKDFILNAPKAKEFDVEFAEPVQAITKGKGLVNQQYTSTKGDEFVEKIQTRTAEIEDGKVKFEALMDEKIAAIPEIYEGKTADDIPIDELNVHLYREYLKETNPDKLRRLDERINYKPQLPYGMDRLSAEEKEKYEVEFYDEALKVRQAYLNRKAEKLMAVYRTPEIQALVNEGKALNVFSDEKVWDFYNGPMTKEDYITQMNAALKRSGEIETELRPLFDAKNKLTEQMDANMLEAETFIKRYPKEAARRLKDEILSVRNDVIYENGLPMMKSAANIPYQVGHAMTDFAAKIISIPQVMNWKIGDNVEDRIADIAMNWAESVNKEYMPTPSKFDKSIIGRDKEGELTFNSEVLLPKVVRTLADMAIMVAPAMSGAGLTGTVAASYTLTAKDFYDEGLEAGLNQLQASQFANVLGLTTGLLELVNPEAKLFQTPLKKMAANQAAKMLSEGMSMNQVVRELVPMVFKNIGKENAQEFLQGTAEKVGKYSANQLVSADFDLGDMEAEAYETLILTTLVSGLAGGGIGGLKSRRSELEKQALYGATDNPQMVIEAVNKAVQLGVMTPENAKVISEQVVTLKQNLDLLPDNVPQSERVELVNGLYDKTKLTQAIQNENIDSGVKKLYEDRIKKIDGAVSKIVSKYVDEAGVPKTNEEVVEEQTKTQQDAIQKQESESVDARQQAETGQEVGEEIPEGQPQETAQASEVERELTSEKEAISLAIEEAKINDGKTYDGVTLDELIEDQQLIEDSPEKYYQKRINHFVGEISRTDISQSERQKAFDALGKAQDALKIVAPKIAEPSNIPQDVLDQAAQDLYDKPFIELTDDQKLDVETEASARVDPTLLQPEPVAATSTETIKPKPDEKETTQEGSAGEAGYADFTAKGGNKVVDKKGEPLTVYHGTKENFKDFDETKMGATDEGWFGKGFYFHTDPNRGGYGDIVKSVNVNLKNPIELPVNNSGKYLYDIVGEKAGLDKSFRDKSSMAIIKEIGSNRFTKLAKELGYDGVIINYVQGTKEIVAFDKSQIKAVEQSTPVREDVEQQIESVNKKVDEAAEWLKKKLKVTDLPSGTEKMGISQDEMIDLIARGVKALVAKGIKTQAALNQVIDALMEGNFITKKEEKKYRANAQTVVDADLEKVYVSKNGKYTILKDENGYFGVRDEKGKLVSAYRRKQVVKEFIDNYRFDTGKRAEIDQGIKEDEIARFIAENSKNPQEILENMGYLNRVANEDELDYTERMIAENIGFVSTESFYEFSDRNLLKKEGSSYDKTSDGIKLNYLRNNGTTVDMIAQSAEYAAFGESDGSQITPQDVVDFILKYPGGVKEFYNQKSPDYAALADAFYDITGFDATQGMIDRALSDQSSATEFAGLEPTDPDDVTTTPDPEMKKRRFTQQFLKDPNISGQVKAMVKKDTIDYMVAPNVLTLAEANSIIDLIGEDQAEKDVINKEMYMSPAVRIMLGQILIRRFDKSGQDQRMLDMLDAMAKTGTAYGQGIQIFALWSVLTPEGMIRISHKMVDKQRQERSKKDSGRRTKAKQTVEQTVNDTIDEALRATGVDKSIASASQVQSKGTRGEYGAKNKFVTKERAKELRNKLRGKFFVNPVDSDLIEYAAYHIEASGRNFADFAQNITSDLGGKIRPYLKQIYEGAKKFMLESGDRDVNFSTDEQIAEYLDRDRDLKIEKQFEKAIKLKNDKDFAVALDMLRQSDNPDSIWQKYKSYAAGRLKGVTSGVLESKSKSSPILDEFTSGLIANMRAMMKQGLPETKRDAVDKIPPIKILADGAKNFEKYEQVWEAAREAVIAAHPNKGLQMVDLLSYFAGILDSPFSEKLVRDAVKGELKSLDKTISDIAKSHYTVYDSTKRTLTDKLIGEADLPQGEAKRLATAIEKEFDRIFAEKRKSMLDQLKKDKVATKKAIKQLGDDLQKLINLGAFNDEQFQQKWADANGYPKLTKENLDKLKLLADKVQTANEGFEKFRALEDLLKYQSQIKGINWWEVPMAIWYANMLSGYSTQQVNFLSTAALVGVNYMTAVVQNPLSRSNYVLLTRGLYEGITHGFLEAGEVWRTGYSPIRGKLEIPTVLETRKFRGGKWNPFNYHKYVRRAMVAADVIFYEGAKEMRAYQLARQIAVKENKIDPDLDIMKRSLAILNKTDPDYQRYQDNAQTEFDQKVDEINASDATPGQKKRLLAQAMRDKTRRVFEQMHLERGGIVSEMEGGKDIVEASAQFAARSTYNYPPDGLLGVLAVQMNGVLRRVNVLRLAIPFTNIIANVASEALNYTPYGFGRAALDGSILNAGSKTNKSIKPHKTLTANEKADMYTKAMIGTGLSALAFILSGVDGDDDDPVLEITANGYGDFKKNYLLKDAGWHPYSFRIKNPITGNYSAWFSYQYTPLVLTFSLIGNFRDSEKYKKEKVGDDTWKKMSMAATQMQRVMFDMTFLASLDNVLNVALNPQVSDLQERGLKGVMGTMKTFVVPNLWTQIFKLNSEINDIPLKQANQFYAGFLRDIPVARNMMSDMVNALGDPVIPTMDKFVKWGEGDLYFKEVVDKGMDNLSVPGYKTLSTTDPKTGEEIPYTNEQYYEFCKIRGGIIKSQLKLAMESGYEVKMGRNVVNIEARYESNKKVIEELSKPEQIAATRKNEADRRENYKKWMTTTQSEATKQAKLQLFANDD